MHMHLTLNNVYYIILYIVTLFVYIISSSITAISYIDGIMEEHILLTLSVLLLVSTQTGSAYKGKIKALYCILFQEYNYACLFLLDIGFTDCCKFHDHS